MMAAMLSSARRKCALPIPTSDFTTAFPLTENPIVLGGILQRGAADGGDWTDPKTLGGEACGSTTIAGFNDAIAHLKTSYRTFNANQFGKITIFRAGGYSPDTGHECEILLHFSISSHDAHGYEVLWAHDGRLNLVRWNGPLGDYNAFDAVETNIGAPADGDVLYAQVVGNLVTVKKNNSTVKTWTLTDISGTVYNSGQPGFGFFPQSGGTVVVQNYGIKNYTAGDL